jgi:hypothetical protein
MFWGSLAGFTSTIIQVGAPPYQVHILPQRLDKLTLIGTTIIFFALVNVMKLVPYFALGQFSTQTLATSAVLLPFAVASNFFGLWLARHPDRAVLPDHLSPDAGHLAGLAVAGRRRRSCRLRWEQRAESLATRRHGRLRMRSWPTNDQAAPAKYLKSLFRELP